MTLEEILARLESDAAQHMTAGPAAAAELEQLEAKLDVSLPEDYRAFLARLGGGMYYQQHEIFGSRRVMIHDIEMVPDMVSMRQRLREGGASLAGGTLYPLHRGRGQIHLIDLGEERPGRVLNPAGDTEYDDFRSFLEAVVLPAQRKT